MALGLKSGHGPRQSLKLRTVGHTLLIHPKKEPDRRSRLFAERLAPDSVHNLVVLDLPPGSLDQEWEAVAKLLADRPGGVRLVYGHGTRENVHPVGQRLADRLGRPVLAPDGEPLLTPGGHLFIPSEHGAGWLRFRPGRVVERDSRRFPKPHWEFSIPDSPREISPHGVAEPMPSGIWVRSTADRRLNTHRQRLMHVMPAHPDILTVVIGSPGAPEVLLEDVVGLCDSVLPNARALARFVHYGPVALPDDRGLGQALADALEQQVVLYGGVPVQAGAGFGPPEIRGVRADGWINGRPFITELTYRPGAEGETAPPPALYGLRAPLTGLRELSYGVYEFSPDAVLEIVQSGLWVRPHAEPAGGDDIRRTPAEPGSPLILFDRSTAKIAERMRSLAQDMLWRLEPEARETYRVAPADDPESVREAVPYSLSEQESWDAAEQELWGATAVAAPSATERPPAPGTAGRAGARRAFTTPGSGRPSAARPGAAPASPAAPSAPAAPGDLDMRETGAADVPAGPERATRPVPPEVRSLIESGPDETDAEADSTDGTTGKPDTEPTTQPRHGETRDNAAPVPPEVRALIESGPDETDAEADSTDGTTGKPDTEPTTQPRHGETRDNAAPVPPEVRALIESGPDETDAEAGYPETGAARSGAASGAGTPVGPEPAEDTEETDGSGDLRDGDDDGAQESGPKGLARRRALSRQLSETAAEPGSAARSEESSTGAPGPGDGDADDADDSETGEAEQGGTPRRRLLRRLNTRAPRLGWLPRAGGRPASEAVSDGARRRDPHTVPVPPPAMPENPEPGPTEPGPRPRPEDNEGDGPATGGTDNAGDAQTAIPDNPQPGPTEPGPRPRPEDNEGDGPATGGTDNAGDAQTAIPDNPQPGPTEPGPRPRPEDNEGDGPATGGTDNAGDVGAGGLEDDGESGTGDRGVADPKNAVSEPAASEPAGAGPAGSEPVTDGEGSAARGTDGGGGSVEADGAGTGTSAQEPEAPQLPAAATPAAGGTPRPPRPAALRIRLESGAPEVPGPALTGTDIPAGKPPAPEASPSGPARPDTAGQAVPGAEPAADAAAQGPAAATTAAATPAVKVQPVPKAAACAVPPERGLEQERAWVRRSLSEQYNSVESAVSGVLAESPGLRGRSGTDSSDALTDLVAVRLYLFGDHRGLDAAVRGATVGPHVPLARCVASGLRRLPSYRGPALLHARLGDAERAWYREGRLATEWAFCSARTTPYTGPAGSDNFLIWSLTARRTSLLDPDVPDRVLFLPGTSFKVLRVQTGERHAVLLRELSPSEIAKDGRVETGHTPLDEIALKGLEQTLKILTESGSRGAPKAPVGSVGSPPGLILPSGGPKGRTTAGQAQRRKAARK